MEPKGTLLGIITKILVMNTEVWWGNRFEKGHMENGEGKYGKDGLVLIKHHAMKTYGVVEIQTAPLFLYHGTRWK
jgi:hypothetical protein